MRFIIVTNVNTSQIFRINMDHVVKYTSKESFIDGQTVNGTLFILSNGEQMTVKETITELDMMLIHQK